MKLAVMPASMGCRPAMVFGGRKKTSPDSYGIEWCALQLSRTSATFLFCRSMRSLTSMSSLWNSARIIHAFPLGRYFTGILAALRNSAGFSTLQRQKGRHMSLPSVFAHKNTAKSSLLCFQPLHESPLMAGVLRKQLEKKVQFHPHCIRRGRHTCPRCLAVFPLPTGILTPCQGMLLRL